MLRRLGALALLGAGSVHLQQLTVGHYSAIPTIGTLFALDFASATLIACGLALFGGRLLAAAGIGVAAGSLVGLAVSERTPLFGFMESGYRFAIVLSAALEAATIALLALHLSRARRR